MRLIVLLMAGMLGLGACSENAATGSRSDRTPPDQRGEARHLTASDLPSPGVLAWSTAGNDPAAPSLCGNALRLPDGDRDEQTWTVTDPSVTGWVQRAKDTVVNQVSDPASWLTEVRVAAHECATSVPAADGSPASTATITHDSSDGLIIEIGESYAGGAAPTPRGYLVISTGPTSTHVTEYDNPEKAAPSQDEALALLAAHHVRANETRQP